MSAREIRNFILTALALAAAATLRCRHLVLLHASRRHRLLEVEDLLEEHLRPLLSCEMHHLNVDWE